MSLEAEKQHARKPGDESPSGDTPEASNDADLNDAGLQERYREEYIAQLKRRSCPGCGEDGNVF